ncbi:UDP-N-acetylmuramoyl-tripeptide--D-alanyl-D-alanine ligase [Alkalihalobacillus macyae]|uniref:UDP-N-acetylmuramoyl-tripeptide--D-alanyl-D-alanine ligase n=2 Tax=Guptibacillus hwajinpoensis TaxID=208199 RepID=A0A0J6CUM8_9BACL|nr:UDP-N-acetylmuramoyl-tripeptide--D-alanyl-D-alanine ligase [Alkalihalobacillus macyae]KMM36903.1 UDP-N-acetylmuramoyl-tripeptide--D-alanyl-D-alanine ligase [Alkalihalobacillus macyae]
MRNLRLSEILKLTDGQVIQGSGDPMIHHVVNRTKKDIEDHTLLFHLDHERIKGKYWIKYEVVVVITDRPDKCIDLGENIILIQTEHLKEDYWKFVEYYRNLFDFPIIGITGTCGKTTTKEMVRQILLEDFNVTATWMSMNSMSVNLRYLNKLDDDTEVAVFEMPVAYPGYLRVACRYFKPQIRVLLNIGVHHLADCDTPEEYMKAKGEIVEGLPEDGTLILNSDDKNIRQVLDLSRFPNAIHIGMNEKCHYRAINARYDSGGMAFTLLHKGKSYDAFVPGYGIHNIYNALAAIAAVSSVGVDIPITLKRLASYKQVKEHLEFKKGANGSTIIDDTWNSAPLSMATGLDVLSAVTDGKKSIGLLGYMPQLGKGKYATEQYEQMGQKAAEAKIDLLIIVGERAEEIGHAAIKAGMEQEKVHFCETGDEVFKVLQPHLNKDTTILLKVTHRVMKQPSFQELRNKLIL